MKKALIFLFFVLLLSNVNAQWGGSTTTTGNIYRTGNVGIANTSPVSKLELGSDQWLKFQASTTAGILFREGSNGHTATDVQYGAKIYYDEHDDVLRISTMQNYIENGAIWVKRVYPRVGIGDITSPDQVRSALNVKGSSNDAQLEMGNSATYDGNYIMSYDRVASTYRNLVISTQSNTTMTLLTNGNVGIGCTDPQVKLAVDGTIQATELTITTTPCSDFVFEPGYSLMDLNSLEEYVMDKKHLPEVPSAQEFAENGYSVGEMDDLLLRKIEELTLYIIKQQKEFIKQQNMIINQQKEIDELKSKLN